MGIFQLIRENQEKVARAEKRIAEDTATLERKTRDTEAMHQRVLQIEKVQEMMEKQVEDLRIYEVGFIRTEYFTGT